MVMLQLQPCCLAPAAGVRPPGACGFARLRPRYILGRRAQLPVSGLYANNMTQQ